MWDGGNPAFEKNGSGLLYYTVVHARSCCSLWSLLSEPIQQNEGNFQKLLFMASLWSQFRESYPKQFSIIMHQVVKACSYESQDTF